MITWSLVNHLKNKHLKETLYKLQEANLTLNEEKCEFAKSSVEFLDTIVNSEGIQVDPKKVEFTIIIIYNEDGKL